MTGTSGSAATTIGTSCSTAIMTPNEGFGGDDGHERFGGDDDRDERFGDDDGHERFSGDDDRDERFGGDHDGDGCFSGDDDRDERFSSCFLVQSWFGVGLRVRVRLRS